MRMPFPGMDPYLESIWHDVHTQMVPVFRTLLTPRLAPKYITDLSTRIVIEHLFDDLFDGRIIMPDVAVLHSTPEPVLVGASPAITAPSLELRTPIQLPTRLVTLHIREAATMRLVTVIELLSPVNKRGERRREYLQKCEEMLDSAAHLVEIDLLRVGRRMPFLGEYPATPYLAMVSRAYARPKCEAWPIGLAEPLPVLAVPLLYPDPDVPLDLGEALRITYESARYDLRLDYGKPPPPPPLSEEDVTWLDAHLRAVGARS